MQMLSRVLRMYQPQWLLVQERGRGRKRSIRLASKAFADASRQIGCGLGPEVQRRVGWVGNAQGLCNLKVHPLKAACSDFPEISSISVAAGSVSFILPSNAGGGTCLCQCCSYTGAFALFMHMHSASLVND